MFTSRIRKLGLPLALALATLATFTPTASAQRYSSKSAKHSGVSVQFGSHGVSFGAHYGKRSKHSSFGLSVAYGSHGYGSPRYGTSHGYRAYASPSCFFVPGRYETVKEQVWVPGHSLRVWIQPEFHVWTDHHGVLQRNRIAGGVWQTVPGHGHWKTLHKQVWVPGNWQCSGGHHH
ncbi:MAG: hypothetical protein E2O39_04710 [Planctomycetota bacterium]|nr:MAG: hypothetical protein E2O39_04710 [Planctomycetota bacterium]